MRKQFEALEHHAHALANRAQRAFVARQHGALELDFAAFGSLLSITIKDTAIASVIAVAEFMRQSETVAGQSVQPIEVYTFAMLVYFAILFPVTRGVELVYRRVAHLGRS